MPMGQKNTDTAVLIFSLSARQEAERKALFGNGKKQHTNEFFDILIERTKKLAAESGVDAYFIDEGQQEGLTFGERYANAFQQIFDKGYTKVVSIGNDSPDLTAETLRKAIDEIQHKELVVGPSADGGIYLLGLSHSLFNVSEFLNLPWMQDSLCVSLAQCDYWQQGGSCFLDTLIDIDDLTSLLQFVQNTCDRLLEAFIQKHLFTSKIILSHRVDILFSNAHIFNPTLRGPPSNYFHTKRVLKAA